MLKLVTGGLLLAAAVPAAAQTATYPANPARIALGSGTYTQDFNSLAATGTTGSALPAGWQVSERGQNANTTYGVGNGSNNAGNAYSFGSTGSTDRALGSIGSGNLAPVYYGALFTNALAGTIASIAIDYTGEQWRGGAAGLDRLTFQYSLDATGIGSGTWVSFSALDFVSPSNATSTALNGNLAANRRSIGAIIAGLSIGAGQGFAIRWTDLDTAGADDGLAIDDLRLSATLAAVVPEPASWALMIAGFGIVGGALRRRRRPAFA